jgi:hypothetical protein
MFNPNCTGQGQSCSRQLWREIADKILMYRIFFKILYSYRNIFQTFLNFRHDLKNYVLTSIWCFFSKVQSRSNPVDPPPSLVLLLIQITWAWEKSRWVHDPAPVNISASFWSQAVQSAGGGWFSVGPALLLFLTCQLTPHWCGQIPETIALYDTLSKYQGRSV